jgi:hypothetical protein
MTRPRRLAGPLAGRVFVAALMLIALNTRAEVAAGKPINFANHIVPIFTKTGCNGGGCHGKSGGQNGFRLSLLGFEPTEDYEWLVQESRGRRLSPAAPERSLLLLKAAAIVPHGGGKRLDVGSADYKLLVRWIAEGMPVGSPNDPKIASIEVEPRERTMPLSGQQQLKVMAVYSDGSKEDVTASALYDVNDKEVGTVDGNGLLKVHNQPGEVAVMVRYCAQVGVFRATVPLGAAVDKLPPAKNFIDEIVFKRLKTVGMPPSDLADDATFLRRVTFDVAGRLPTLDETQGFIADPSPDKRDRAVDRLVDSSDYADYFANKWSALLRNKRAIPAHKRGNYAFFAWIRDAMATNKPYDQFVREVVAASGDTEENPPVTWYRQVTTAQQQLEDTAQLFLGTRLQCAQCHHHPYEKWSQNDYYSFAAFFSTVTRKPGNAPGEEVIYAKRGVPTATNKKTGLPVKPAGLGARPLDVAPDDDPRQALVDWMAAPDNKLFAPALANRYWKHFFGRGLVDPEDDLRGTNPPTNPELLDALAKHFVDARFDLKDLVRTICKSSTYQLSAIPNQFNATDRQNYSRYYPKRLSAEVLYDGVHAVTLSTPTFAGLPAGTRAVQLPDNSFNAANYFLQVFGRPDSASACECERSMDASLAQCLHLFNSKEIQDKLSGNAGRAAVLAADKRGDDEKIRELYLRSFGRQPEPEEMSLAMNYLARTVKDKDGKEAPADKRQSYEDILWAMLNTKEFLFNH